jgi:hypothetical protein
MTLQKAQETAVAPDNNTRRDEDEILINIVTNIPAVFRGLNVLSLFATGRLPHSVFTY